MPRGGKRPNSGPAKGTKYGPQKATLRAAETKELARDAFRDFIAPHVEAMHRAQVEHAKGLSYIVARHIKTGKFAKLTEDLIQSIEDGTNRDYERIEVWSKDPSIQAYSDLINRYMDKPIEQREHTHRGAIRMIHELAE